MTKQDVKRYCINRWQSTGIELCEGKLYAHDLYPGSVYFIAVSPAGLHGHGPWLREGTAAFDTYEAARATVLKRAKRRLETLRRETKHIQAIIGQLREEMR